MRKAGFRASCGLTRTGLAVRFLVVAACGVSLALLPAGIAYAGGYNTPTAGQSPHGNYADTTNKCKVCHAVHNANASVETTFAPPQALLRTNRGIQPPTWPSDRTKNGAACAYCHIAGVWSIKTVYGGLLSNYQSDSRFNHDDNHRRLDIVFPTTRANYSGCMSCHSVHGANLLVNVADGISSNDIVSVNPNPDWNAITVGSLTDFCRDCHDDSAPVFVSGTWGTRCGWCHNASALIVRGGNDDTQFTDQLPPFYTQDRDDVSHVMTATLTGVGGSQTAWADTTDCRDCHKGGNGTANNSFPHFTAGAQFLEDGYATPDSGMDRVCLGCHVQGGYVPGYSTGVGKTF